MKKIKFLAPLVWINLAATSGSLAAPLNDDPINATQDSCLKAAAQRHEAQLDSVESAYLTNLNACDGPGPSGFADRCALIASRRFKLATQKAHDSYLAEQEACLTP